ncbi:hypothetical protein J7I44_12535 [Frateuria sp. MAH-13]|uniref:Uncharacterized protein n=1 Tax=Frateuria flava TaxID=2821489 RepID=A0ABS4DPZ2_9GAMM|nr:hypothetical protein [Frateuria flava]MBP1475132.1 hypothetical protein [Frateuria flava]
MKRVVVLSIASLLASACVGPASSLAAGLCRAGETTYFSCRTAQHTTISLCGSLGAMQYRYGKADKVELAFPEDAWQGSQQLGYAHYTRYRTERSEVGFSRSGVDYALFDDSEDGHRSAGVRVTTAEGTDHEVACHGPVEGRLDTLGKSLRCDADNALNGGNCP